MTLVKLGDISAKKQGGQKAEGNIQGTLRKKPINQEFRLDQNYLLKDRDKTRCSQINNQKKKYINRQLPHRNYRRRSSA